MSSADNKHPPDAISTALTASRGGISLEPGEVNTYPHDATSTAFSAPRSNLRQEGGRHQRAGGQKREHLARDDVIHRNQNKKARRVGNGRKFDATERHRLVIIEQQNFRDCEIKFLPLIRRWESAIRNKDSDQLSGIYKYLFYKIESFTVPFIEEYDVKHLITESKDLVVKDRNVVKKVRDKFSRSINTKMRNVPEGFKARKAKKARNEDFNNNRTIGNEYFDRKKRHIPEDFKARKEKNEDFNKRTPGKEYVDVFVANGEVIKSCEKKLQTILLRAIKLGRHIPYGEQFVNARSNTHQLEIASSVWGSIRNTEYPPVR
jgi:hypothetical protein